MIYLSRGLYVVEEYFKSSGKTVLHHRCERPFIVSQMNILEYTIADVMPRSYDQLRHFQGQSRFQCP